MNILVGPNNCGKSTILGAFRLLAQGMRRARARRARMFRGPSGLRLGWQLSDDALPISVENIHTNYDDIDTVVEFGTSNRGTLTLFFPEDGGIFFFADTNEGPVTTPSELNRELPVNVQVVPVLGPIEHQEAHVTADTVLRNLATTRASRNFRNYWLQNPDGFADFATMISSTWPGMEIRPPEVQDDIVVMFCLERRMTRELYWAGFGFQIWCQLLSHIFRTSTSSLIIVDEPEIYLHPDVQRQLLSILRDTGPDILLATHSTEIMSEADPSEILLVDKDKRSAERLRDVEGVQNALDLIGSIQNITLTRLAKNRRLLFLEGESDFRLVRRFARKLGLTELASGTDLTSLEARGFSSWERIRDMASGFETALGVGVHVGAVFDRDYWCPEEIDSILADLNRHIEFAHIHERKEIENYLLVPEVLERATEKAIHERARRSGRAAAQRTESIEAILERLTDPLKAEVQSQYIAKRVEFLKRTPRDDATITAETIKNFEGQWREVSTRMMIVPGKQTLALLRDDINNTFSISLTDHRIVSEFSQNDIPADLVNLLHSLDEYRNA